MECDINMAIKNVTPILEQKKDISGKTTELQIKFEIQLTVRYQCLLVLTMYHGYTQYNRGNWVRARKDLFCTLCISFKKSKVIPTKSLPKKLDTVSRKCLLLSLFLLFRATLLAHRSSQARGRIRAIGTSPHHSHSNA